ncbi:Aquaporin SIP1-1 [Linum perenne]
MGLIKSAAGDFILTSMWVFSVPLLIISSAAVSSSVGAEPKSLASLFVTVNVAAVFVLFFSTIGALLGGASFNPTTTVTFYAAGLKPDLSLISLAVRFPIQAAAAVLGANGIGKILLPTKFRYVLGGPSLKVDLHTGAAAELGLSFILCFALLLIMVKGPRNSLVKVWLLAVVTVGLIFAGGKLTGPSMNPANAYGWAYVNDRHRNWELFYVYWVSPIFGAIVAASVFKLLFKTSPPPAPSKPKEE